MLEPAIIYEDNHLLIAQKPPGYLAQPDGRHRPDMLTWAEAYLGRNKPGRAFVGLVHRLDREVGGVMALAKTSKCAERLSRQFRERRIGKFYLTLVPGRPGSRGHLEGNLFRDETLTRPAEKAEKGTFAALNWQTLAAKNDFSLLEIELLTGFKHQIRAQLSALGHPVVGDVKYGSPYSSKITGIGLWAARLVLTHPTRQTLFIFEAPPPHRWPWALGPLLGENYFKCARGGFYESDH